MVPENEMLAKQFLHALVSDEIVIAMGYAIIMIIVHTKATKTREIVMDIKMVMVYEINVKLYKILNIHHMFVLDLYTHILRSL